MKLSGLGFATALSLFLATMPLLPSQSAESRDIANSCNQFGLGLTKELSPHEKGNFVLSPYSAYVILSLLRNGAGGETADEIAVALSQKGRSVNDVNKLTSSLTAENKTTGKDIFEAANSIFVQKDFTIKPQFKEKATKIYSAQAETVDFASPAAVKTINDWASLKTHDKIKDLLGPLPASTKMVLVNAVYFKGAWQDPFKEFATRDEDFFAESGRVSVKMMHRSGRIGYVKGRGFEAVNLPYSEGKQRMVVILPNKGTKLNSFIAQFTDADWSSIAENDRSVTVNLALPRFRIESKFGLTGALSKLGMKLAFSSSSADFSNLSSDRLFVSDVIQKAFVETNEKGTEAAAATAVVMEAMSVCIPVTPPIEFKADRPFVFAVAGPNNEILFLGAVAKP